VYNCLCQTHALLKVHLEICMIIIYDHCYSDIAYYYNIIVYIILNIIMITRNVGKTILRTKVAGKIQYTMNTHVDRGCSNCRMIFW